MEAFDGAKGLMGGLLLELNNSLGILKELKGKFSQCIKNSSSLLIIPMK